MDTNPKSSSKISFLRSKLSLIISKYLPKLSPTFSLTPISESQMTTPTSVPKSANNWFEGNC